MFFRSKPQVLPDSPYNAEDFETEDSADKETQNMFSLGGSAGTGEQLRTRLSTRFKFRKI